MAVSTVHESDLDEGLQVLAGTPVSAIYLVDSFGSFYSEEIRALTKKYLDACKGTEIQVGIHTHNNQQLAYANTIEAIVSGANRLDATLSGLGRGAGNCPLELLIGFLKNPRYSCADADCIERHISRCAATCTGASICPHDHRAENQHRARDGVPRQGRGGSREHRDFYDAAIEQV
jgi:4-hydroxy 2-oxovalerate aldolase